MQSTPETFKQTDKGTFDTAVMRVGGWVGGWVEYYLFINAKDKTLPQRTITMYIYMHVLGHLV